MMARGGDSDDSDDSLKILPTHQVARKASHQFSTRVDMQLQKGNNHFSLAGYNENRNTQQISGEFLEKFNRESFQSPSKMGVNQSIIRPMTVQQNFDHNNGQLLPPSEAHAKEVVTTRMSEAVKSQLSSCSNSSDEDANKTSNDNSSSSSRKSGDVETKALLTREQIKVFIISYFTNMFSLLGLSYFFVTSTFYDDNNDPTHIDPTKQVITLPEIQVVLLSTSIMYILLGSSLEYIRGVEFKIIIPLIALYGVIKIVIGIYDIFVDLDLEVIIVSNLQLVHFIVIMRLAISMIFITTLSKWFSRTYLHLVMGTWFTNEFIAFEITKALSEQKNYLIFASGILLLFSSVAIYQQFKFDPIDGELVINEQAINLTSQHTDTCRTYIQLDTFIEEMKSSKYYQELVAGNQNSSNVSIQKLKQHAILNYEEKVLKRWKTPSLLHTLRLSGVGQMLLCTICLFFKYRILNKFVVIMNTEPPKDSRVGMIGCFLLSSEIIQVLFGYMILKWLKGRRYIFQALLLIIDFGFELTQVLFYSVQDEKPNFMSDSSYYLITLDGIIVYSLYYMMCLCGPVDMAKIELLKTNFKVAGMLFGIVCASQCIVQGLFLDELIDKFLNKDYFQHPGNFYIISSVNLACSLIAFFSIFGIVQEEFKELQAFKMTRKKEIDNELQKSYMMSSNEIERTGFKTGSDRSKDQHLLDEDVSSEDSRDMTPEYEVKHLKTFGSRDKKGNIKQQITIDSEKTISLNSKKSGKGSKK